MKPYSLSYEYRALKELFCLTDPSTYARAKRAFHEQKSHPITIKYEKSTFSTE